MNKTETEIDKKKNHMCKTKRGQNTYGKRYGVREKEKYCGRAKRKKSEEQGRRRREVGGREGESNK